MYAMKEYDLFMGSDCPACSVLKQNMDKKDRDRCNMIDVGDVANIPLVTGYGVSTIPCLLADGRKIFGASAILDFLKTH